SGAIRDYARVTRIVFFDLEDDFHQVRADVCDLGKDTARNTQSRGSKRFADRESDKARTGIITRHEQQNKEHDEQLNAHQEHTDAHARLERDRIQREWLTAKSGERRARVRKSVYANAEPGDAIAAEDADDAEGQNDRQREGYRMPWNRREDPEVQCHDDGNEDPEHGKKLALRYQVGLTGFVDQFGYLAHRAVHRKVLQLEIDREPEEESKDTEDQTDQQKCVPVHAEEVDAGKIGKFKIGLATGLCRLSQGHWGLQHKKRHKSRRGSENTSKKFGNRGDSTQWGHRTSHGLRGQ